MSCEEWVIWLIWFVLYSATLCHAQTKQMQTTRKQYNKRWLFRLLVIPILLRKKHWGFLLAHEYSKYCLWWGKKFTSSDLFHLGATVLHTHILQCIWVECNVNTLSGAQCQHWYLDRQHNAPSTIALSQCATSLSTSTKIQPRAFFLLHFFQFYQICSCPRANTWMTPSYQLRVLGEKWHFKLRVRRWQSRCKSYEWYQHHILCSIQTFFLVC